jgi:multiple sugar transport system substrate-binding protein
MTTPDAVSTFRSSRRALLARAIATGLGAGVAGRPVRAQPSSSRALRFVGWVHREPSTRESMRRALDMFEQIHGVRVEAIGIGFASSPDALQATEPDIMQLSGNEPRLLGSRGVLADLGPLRDEAPELFRNPFQGSVEGGTYEGVLYAAPFTVAPLGFWSSLKGMQNRELAAWPPPTTFDALEEVLAVLKSYMSKHEGEYPMRIDFSGAEYAATRFWSWIWAFGGEPMPEDERGNLLIDQINFAENGTFQAFSWLRSMDDREYLMPFRNGWWDRQLFAHARVGFTIDGPYMTSQIASHNFAYEDGQGMSAAFHVSMPPVREPGRSSFAVADFHYLAVAKRSEHQRLARALVEFLITNEFAIEAFLIPQGGLLPVRRDNVSFTRERDPIRYAFIEEIAPKMRLPPYGPRYGAAARCIARAIYDVVAEKPSRAALEKRLMRLTDDVRAAYVNEAVN